ncbi:MAG: hypothetical protein ABH829_05380 [archaeon]
MRDHLTGFATLNAGDACTIDSDCISGYCRNDYDGGSFCAENSTACVHDTSQYPSEDNPFSTNISDYNGSDYHCKDGHWSEDPFQNSRTYSSLDFSAAGMNASTAVTVLEGAILQSATLSAKFNGTQAYWMTYSASPDDTRLTYDSAASSEPSVLLHPNGDASIVWTDAREGGEEVYYKKINATGSMLVNDTRLSAGGLTSRYVSAAIDTAENIYLVWEDAQDVYFKKANSTGGELVSPTQLTNSTDAYRPYVALDSSGSIHIVWYDRRDWVKGADIYYTKIDGSGATVVDDMRLTTSGTGSSPIAVVDASNSVHVLWVSSSEVYYTKLDNSGNTIIDDTQVTSTGAKSNFPHATVDSSGNISFVWTYELVLHSVSEIYYKQLNLTGSELIGDTQLTYTSAFAQKPKIVNQSCALFVAWYDSRTGNNEVYYKKLNATGGTLINDTQVTNDGGASTYPTVAVDPDLSVYIAWQDDRAGNSEIYFERQSYGSNQITATLEVPAAPPAVTLSNSGTYYSLNMTSQLQQYMNSYCTSGNCTMPITVSVNSQALVVLDNLAVVYATMPVLDALSNQTIVTNQPFVYDINASDLDGGPLTFSDNTALFDIDPASGVISFTPTEFGSHLVNISVSDGTYSDSQVVLFTINSLSECTYDAECPSGYCRNDYDGGKFCAVNTTACVHNGDQYPSEAAYSSNKITLAPSTYRCRGGHWSEDPFGNNNTFSDVSFIEAKTDSSSFIAPPIRMIFDSAYMDVSGKPITLAPGAYMGPYTDSLNDVAFIDKETVNGDTKFFVSGGYYQPSLFKSAVAVYNYSNGAFNLENMTLLYINEKACGLDATTVNGETKVFVSATGSSGVVLAVLNYTNGKLYVENYTATPIGTITEQEVAVAFDAGGQKKILTTLKPSLNTNALMVFNYTNGKLYAENYTLVNSSIELIFDAAAGAIDGQPKIFISGYFIKMPEFVFEAVLAVYNYTDGKLYEEDILRDPANTYAYGVAVANISSQPKILVTGYSSNSNIYTSIYNYTGGKLYQENFTTLRLAPSSGQAVALAEFGGQEKILSAGSVTDGVSPSSNTDFLFVVYNYTEGKLLVENYTIQDNNANYDSVASVTVANISGRQTAVFVGDSGAGGSNIGRIMAYDYFLENVTETPYDVSVDVGTDNSVEWQYTSYLNQSVAPHTIDLKSTLESLTQTCEDADHDLFCDSILIDVSVSGRGVITLDNLRIAYSYYPDTGQACQENLNCSLRYCRNDYTAQKYCAYNASTCVHDGDWYLSQGLFSSLMDAYGTNRRCNLGHWSQDPFADGNTYAYAIFNSSFGEMSSNASIIIRPYKGGNVTEAHFFVTSETNVTNNTLNNVTIDVGNDGTYEWNYTGNFTQTQSPVNLSFASTLTELAAGCTNTNDAYCDGIYINISANGAGTVTLDNLLIDYRLHDGTGCDADYKCNSLHCVHGTCRPTYPYPNDGYCDPGEYCENENACCNEITVLPAYPRLPRPGQMPSRPPSSAPQVEIDGTTGGGGEKGSIEGTGTKAAIAEDTEVMAERESWCTPIVIIKNVVPVVSIVHTEDGPILIELTDSQGVSLKCVHITVVFTSGQVFTLRTNELGFAEIKTYEGDPLEVRIEEGGIALATLNKDELAAATTMISPEAARQFSTWMVIALVVMILPLIFFYLMMRR